MRTFIARSAAEMESLATRWQSLHKASGGTIFQSFAWNLLAAGIFGERERPHVVYAEDGGGAALIPAALARHGTLITLLGEALFDYRHVLACGDSASLNCAWREVARLQQPLWVAGVRATDIAPWQVFAIQHYAEAPFVCGLDGDEFAKAHPRAARLLRRLERKGVRLRQYDGSAAALVRTIYQNKARQLMDHSNNLFADLRRIEFMVAAAGLDPAATEVFTLESAGTLVAALVTFRDGGVRRFYTIYHDRRWADWSPGTALTYEVTRRSLIAGLECDYMTGSQPHKDRFATGSLPLWRVDASPGELASVVAGRESTTALAA